MKKLIITVASLLIMVEHMVQGQGVVMVSDPGQAPSGGFITTNQVVECTHVLLTASNASGQVYVTLNQRTAGSLLDADLFVNGSTTSNKFTGKPVILGPFSVTSGKTNDIVISARINAVVAQTSPVPIALDLTSVSNSMSSAVTGILPVEGTTYVVINPGGILTGIQVFYQYSGAPLDTNGVPLDLLFLKGQGFPSIAYGIEYSTNMETWNPLMSPSRPNLDGSMLVYVFMRLPPQCFYRLKSQ